MVRGSKWGRVGKEKGDRRGGNWPQKKRKGEMSQGGRERAFIGCLPKK